MKKYILSTLLFAIYLGFTGAEIASAVTSSYSIAPDVNVPVVTLSSNGKNVVNGSTVLISDRNEATLSWTSVGATSCTLNGVAIPTSGSQLFSNFKIDFGYAGNIFSCTNGFKSSRILFDTLGRSTNVESINIRVIPQSTYDVRPGEPAQIAIEGQGFSSCTLESEGALIKLVEPSTNTVHITPALQKNTTFKVTCTRGEYTKVKEFTIEVIPINPVKSKTCPLGQIYYSAEPAMVNGTYNRAYLGCAEAKPFTCLDGSTVYTKIFDKSSSFAINAQACSYPNVTDSALFVKVGEGEYIDSQTEGVANITIPDSASGKILVLYSDNPVHWIIANPNHVLIKKILILELESGLNTQRADGDIQNIPLEKIKLGGRFGNITTNLLGGFYGELSDEVNTFFKNSGNDIRALIVSLLKQGISLSPYDYYYASRASALPVGVSPSPTLYTKKQSEIDAKKAEEDAKKKAADAAIDRFWLGYKFASGLSFHSYVYENKNVSNDAILQNSYFYSAGPSPVPTTKAEAITRCKDDILSKVGQVAQCKWNGEVFASSTNPLPMMDNKLLFPSGAYSEYDGSTLIYSKPSISAINAKVFCDMSKTVHPNIKCTFDGIDTSTLDFARKTPGFLQIYGDRFSGYSKFFNSFATGNEGYSAENDCMHYYTYQKLGYIMQEPIFTGRSPEKYNIENFDKSKANALRMACYWNGHYFFSSPANYDPLNKLPESLPSISLPGTSLLRESAPFVEVKANKGTIQLGESVTLNWNSMYTDSCSASGAWSGELSTSSSIRSGSITKTPTALGEQKYIISCAGVGGTARHSVTVNVISQNEVSSSNQTNTLTQNTSGERLITSLTANPSTIFGKGTTTITFTSSGTDSCYIGNTRLSTSGAYVTPVLTYNPSYSPSVIFTLKCFKGESMTSRNISILVSSTSSPSAVLPAGCTSSTMYSPTTGVRCLATLATTPVCNSEQYLENGVCKNLTRICPDGRVISAMLSCGTSTVSTTATSSLLVYRQYYGPSLQQQRSRVTRSTAISLCAARVRAIQGRKTSGLTTYNDVSKIRCTWGTEQLYPLRTSSLSEGSLVLGSSTVCTSLPYNLHRGAESPSVVSLQTFLSSKGFLEGEATGFYGDKTVEAVKAYQSSVNLPATGMVYSFTREAIRAESCQ
ncbi:MAG: peptidoglycan-binding domain-containing protein [Candidatus Paceibacterota bacterium]